MGVLLAFMKSYGPKGESSSLRPDVIAPIVKSYPSDFSLTFFVEIRAAQLKKNYHCLLFSLIMQLLFLNRTKYFLCRSTA